MYNIYNIIYIYVYIYIPHLYSYISGHLGCFHILAFVNSAATKYIYLFELVFYFSSDKYPEVELLYHMVVLFLVFWGTSVLFSKVAATIYNPTNSAWGFLFSTSSPTLVVCCLFDNNHCWQVWGGISLWFWFTFPWWLMMLSTFSCSCWPSVYLLWKMSLQILCPLFFFSFFDKFILFYLFIFGCVGSSLLHAGFLYLQQAGATLHCGAQASHCSGFSCCEALALGMRASVVVVMGSVVVACGLSSCGSLALEHRLSSCGSRA